MSFPVPKTYDERRGRLRAKPLAFCADHLLSELRARGYDR